MSDRPKPTLPDTGRLERHGTYADPLLAVLWAASILVFLLGVHQGWW